MKWLMATREETGLAYQTPRKNGTEPYSENRGVGGRVTQDTQIERKCCV
jgi:hypothetical protein